MSRFILLFVFTLYYGTAYVQGSSDQSIKSFSWLIGEWQMQRKNGVITEHWKQVSDSSFEGGSYFTRSTGEKRVLESVSIAKHGFDFFYIPVVSDQNNQQPVRFRITSLTAGQFIAENPDHDFPKRIIYRLINTDSIHATIDGGSAMPEKKSDFYYSRKKQ